MSTKQQPAIDTPTTLGGTASVDAQDVGEIRHSVFLRAEPERVYDAMTTAEGLDGWFTSGTVSDPRPGGEMTWRWQDWGPHRYSGASTVPVYEAERPRRIVFGWDGEGPPDGDGEPYLTSVEIDFVPEHGGTTVHLRDHGYRDTPAGRRANIDCAIGWGEALALMKVYVEHGIGKD